MEEETTKRIIEVDVDIDSAIKSFQDLGKQIAENKKKMDELDKSSDTYQEDLIKLQQENKVLAQDMRSVEKEIQNSIKQQKAQEDSLVALRAKLSNLNKQYDSMSGIERMGEQGEDLQRKIKALSDEILNLEGNTGRWQRNVGNYKSALKGLKESFSAVGVSTKGVDNAMKILGKNPLMIVLGIIVGILVKMRDKMSETEQVTASLTSATKSLKPIIEVTGKAVSKLADIFSNVLNWAIEKTIEGIGRLGKALQKIGKAFGKDWGGGLVDFSYKMREAKDTIDETNESVEENTEKVMAHTKAVKEDTNAVKDNSAELAKQAEEYRKLTLSEMQKAEDALNNIIEDAFDKRQAIENTAYQRRHDALLEAMVAEEEAHGTQTELYQAYMTQWEAMEKEHADNILAIEKDRIDKEQAVKDAADAKDAERIKKEIALEYSKYESVSKITGSIGKILEAAAGDNEALVRASKITALAEVAIQQGIAISKAVAAAADVPYPGNLLAIMSSVASALAAIVPAISSINSVKLARGISYVKGPGTSTSDSIPAMLSVGEGVVNARGNAMFPGVVQAMNDAGNGIYNPVLSMLRNSGGAPIQVSSQQEAISRMMTASAMREVLQDLDLYVSVEEINRTENRVKAMEQLASV